MTPEERRIKHLEKKLATATTLNKGLRKQVSELQTQVYTLRNNLEGFTEDERRERKRLREALLELLRYP